MNDDILIDHTARNLKDAAEAVRKLSSDILQVELICRPRVLDIRAALGAGKDRRWLTDSCDWEDIASQRKNPILRVIEGVIFRLERASAGDGKEAGAQA